MRTIVRSALVVAVLCAATAEVDAAGRAFDSLWCVPGLSHARIRQGFSVILEKPDCAEKMTVENIGTHLLGIEACRASRPDTPGGRCKSFSFRIDNSTPVAKNARGPRFYLLGSGRWCRDASGEWSAVEPDVVASHATFSGTPSEYDIVCEEPAPTPKIAAAPPIPPAPPPAEPRRPPPPVPVAPSVETSAPVPDPPPPAPPPPMCRGDYRIVCADLLALRYLESATASDDDLHRAVRSFLVDERESRWNGLPSPVELGRLTAVSLERTRNRPPCPSPSAGAGIVACGGT